MARMPFGRHRPRPRPGGGTLIAGLSISVSPSALYVGGAFTITVTVPSGGSVSTISATAGGTPVALTGSGNTRTGTAPAEAGPLVVIATGADADGNPLTANRTVQVREEPVGPPTFAPDQWAFLTGNADGQLKFEIASVPEGMAAARYSIDGGAWTNFPAFVSQLTHFVDGYTPGSVHSARVQAQNSAGVWGPASAAKSAQAAGGDVPALSLALSANALTEGDALTITGTLANGTAVDFTTIEVTVGTTAQTLTKPANFQRVVAALSGSGAGRVTATVIVDGLTVSAGAEFTVQAVAVQSFPAASAYSFTDEFDDIGNATVDPYIAMRDGWFGGALTDYRNLNAYKYASGATSGGSLYVFGDAVLHSLGRTDAGWMEAIAGAAGVQFSILWVSPRTYVSIYASATAIAVRQYINGTLTQVANINANVASGDVLRAEWSWDEAGATLSIMVYQNGTAVWSTPRTIASSTGIVPSPYVGFAGSTITDRISMGINGALPRITIDPPLRMMQSGAGGTRSVTFTGVGAGIDNLQARLLKDGSELSGWGWGAFPFNVSIAEGGLWSATVAGIPDGTGYALEVRGSNVPSLVIRSTTFDVGMIALATGQSLAPSIFSANGNSSPIDGSGVEVTAPSNTYMIAGGTTGDRIKAPLLIDREAIASSSNSLLHNGYFAFSMNKLRPNTARAMGAMNISLGASAMALFLPESTSTPWSSNGAAINLYENLRRWIVYCGGIEHLFFSQGQEDAGRAYTSNIFTEAKAATYKENFKTVIAGLREAAGRDFTVHICMLGRMRPNTAGTFGDYAADDSFDRFRRTQWELSNEVENCVISHQQIDLQLGDTSQNQVHLSPLGSLEDSIRFAHSVNHQSFGVAFDKRGPLPVSAEASGNNLIITYDANGCEAITCAAAIPTNLCVWTDDTFATRVTPTAMSIGVLSGGQIKVTLTLPQAAAGVRVTSGKGGAYSTGGIWPDTDNGLMGTFTLDANSVPTYSIFTPLVAV